MNWQAVRDTLLGLLCMPLLVLLYFAWCFVGDMIGLLFGASLYLYPVIMTGIGIHAAVKWVIRKVRD